MSASPTASGDIPKIPSGHRNRRFVLRHVRTAHTFIATTSSEEYNKDAVTPASFVKVATATKSAPPSIIVETVSEDEDNLVSEQEAAAGHSSPMTLPSPLVETLTNTATIAPCKSTPTIAEVPSPVVDPISDDRGSLVVDQEAAVGHSMTPPPPLATVSAVTTGASPETAPTDTVEATSIVATTSKDGYQSAKELVAEQEAAAGHSSPPLVETSTNTTTIAPCK